MVAIGLRLSLFLALCSVSLCGCAPGPAPKFTEDHRDRVRAALKEAKLPYYLASLEAKEGGWIVATYEVSNVMEYGGPQALAERSLLTIRNALLSENVADSYRVTIHGPSPGPGLVSRYGSARFIEGGEVTWSPAKEDRR